MFLSFPRLTSKVSSVEYGSKKEDPTNEPWKNTLASPGNKFNSDQLVNLDKRKAVVSKEGAA